MAEKKDKQTGDDASPLVDLSDLVALNFGPEWTERKAGSVTGKSGRARPADRRSGPPTRDRRQGGRPEPRREAGDDRHPGGPNTQQGERRPPPRGRSERGDRAPQAVEFKPVVEVSFYPEDIPFKALCHAMRTSCRTYELFEIARLILEKPERFVAIIQAPPKKEPESTQELYVSVPDGLPFLTQDAAISHLLSTHLEHFFEIEEAEVEPPKGNFPTISRCGVTGELLGPPNYHRYQALLQEHHATRLAHMPYEHFQRKIESVKEQESIDAWVQKMTKVKRYRVKVPGEGEPEFIEGLDAVRSFLLNHRRDKALRTSEQARLSGRQLDSLPGGDLKRSIEVSLEHQHRFPLETSNNLRGRLRRMRFTIYKRGSKGVSYVCAVKRNFREPGTLLAKSPQALIEFIEKNPKITAAKLPETFLGINPEQALKAAPERVPNIEAVPVEKAEAIVEQHEIKRQERLAAEKAATAENAEVDAPEANTLPGTEVPAPEATPVADATVETPSHSPETAPAPEPEKPSLIEDPRIRQMLNDLRWLVSEGYVIEYGNGQLVALPPAPAAHGKRDEDSEGHPPAAPPKAEAGTSAEAGQADSGEPQAQMPPTPAPREA